MNETTLLSCEWKRITLFVVGILLLVVGALTFAKMGPFANFQTLRDGTLFMGSGAVTLTAIAALSIQKHQPLRIKEKTRLEIQNNFSYIYQEKNTDAIMAVEYGGKRCFSLKSAPGLIFRIIYDDVIDLNTSYAQKICDKHNLDLIVIPEIVHFTVVCPWTGKNVDVRVEKRNEFASPYSITKEDFETYADRLDESIRQLTTFLCITGGGSNLRSNTYRLMKMPNEGPIPIGIFNYEKMVPPLFALFGDVTNRGLMDFIQERHFQIVYDEASKYLPKETLKKAYDRKVEQRKCEIEDERKIQEKYKKAGIVTGKEPIKVSGKELGFLTAEEIQDCEAFIAGLNKELAEKRYRSTLQARRHVTLNPECDLPKHYTPQKKDFFRRVVEALVKNGKVFSYSYSAEGSYFLQL